MIALYLSKSIQKPLSKDRGNRLTHSNVDEEILALIPNLFLASSFDRDSRLLPSWSTSTQRAVRLLEKTPKNALRLPFLNALFPDAYYIYLYRDPLANLTLPPQNVRLSELL
jgi:hypothetical protein